MEVVQMSGALPLWYDHLVNCWQALEIACFFALIISEDNIPVTFKLCIYTMQQESVLNLDNKIPFTFSIILT